MHSVLLYLHFSLYILFQQQQQKNMPSCQHHDPQIVIFGPQGSGSGSWKRDDISQLVMWKNFTYFPSWC